TRSVPPTSTRASSSGRRPRRCRWYGTSGPGPDRHLAQPDRVHSFRTTDIDAGVFRWIVENRSYGTLSTQSVRRRALEAKVADLRHVECVTDVSMALLMMSAPGRHR